MAADTMRIKGLAALKRIDIQYPIKKAAYKAQKKNNKQDIEEKILLRRKKISLMEANFLTPCIAMSQVTKPQKRDQFHAESHSRMRRSETSLCRSTLRLAAITVFRALSCGWL